LHEAAADQIEQMKRLFPSDKQEQKDTKSNRRFWKDSLADGAAGVTLDRSVLAFGSF
jgi:hypothetical protein